MKLQTIAESVMPLGSRLLQLRSILATAAQHAYDGWEQDAEGLDEVYGGGGICDEIAQRMGYILTENDIDYTEGGHDGDDHAYLVAYDDASTYIVDIPPQYYERGGGMAWTKHPDVMFTPDMVIVSETTRPDWIEDEEFVDEIDIPR